MKCSVIIRPLVRYCDVLVSNKALTVYENVNSEQMYFISVLVMPYCLSLLPTQIWNKLIKYTAVKQYVLDDLQDNTV